MQKSIETDMMVTQVIKGRFYFSINRGQEEEEAVLLVVWKVVKNEVGEKVECFIT